MNAFILFLAGLITFTSPFTKNIIISDESSFYLTISTFYFPSSGGLISATSLNIPKDAKTTFHLVFLDFDTLREIENNLEDISPGATAIKLTQLVESKTDKFPYITVQQGNPSDTNLEHFVGKSSIYMVLLLPDKEHPVSFSFNLEIAYFTKHLTPTEYRSLKTDSERESVKRYLSYERNHEITIKMLFFFGFTALLIVYIDYCRKHITHVLKIHYIIGISILSKTLLLLIEHYYLISMNKYGHCGFISFLYYVATFVKTFTLLLVVILLGSGWSYMKSVLSKDDRTVLLSVLIVQVLLNIAYVMRDKVTSSIEFTFSLTHIIYLADIFCFAVSVIPLQNTVISLRKSSHMDGKAAYNIARIKSFLNFYSLIMVFIYSTRFIKFVLMIILGPKWMFIVYFWENGSDLMLYYVIMKLFRPKRFILDRKHVDDVELEEITKEDVEETQKILKEKDDVNILDI